MECAEGDEGRRKCNAAAFDGGKDSLKTLLRSSLHHQTGRQSDEDTLMPLHALESPGRWRSEESNVPLIVTIEPELLR